MYESNSVEDTIAFAIKMAINAKPGDIICLCGPLGAGKTVFAQGYAKGLGVSDYVNSPTFTLMQVYDTGRLPLYHFDLYRLLGHNQIDPGEIDLDTLDDIGFLEYLDGDGVCLIEWAEYGRNMVPDGAYWVEISRKDENGIDGDGKEKDGKDKGEMEKRTIYVHRL